MARGYDAWQRQVRSYLRYGDTAPPRPRGAMCQRMLQCISVEELLGVLVRSKVSLHQVLLGRNPQEPLLDCPLDQAGRLWCRTGGEKNYEDGSQCPPLLSQPLQPCLWSDKTTGALHSISVWILIRGGIPVLEKKC